MEGIELLHVAALGEEDVLDRAAEAWVALTADTTNDYQVRRTRDGLLDRFKDEARRFLAALDARIAADGASPGFTTARIDLLIDVGRAVEARATSTRRSPRSPRTRSY